MSRYKHISNVVFRATRKRSYRDKRYTSLHKKNGTDIVLAKKAKMSLVEENHLLNKFETH